MVRWCVLLFVGLLILFVINYFHQDVLTLRPSPIFAFDVVPEEASPFYVPIPIPPIVVNSEATVKDTINVLIQWVRKREVKEKGRCREEEINS